MILGKENLHLHDGPGIFTHIMQLPTTPQQIKFDNFEGQLYVEVNCMRGSIYHTKQLDYY